MGQVNDIANTLAERQKTHGDFTDHARITQRLKIVVQSELARAKTELTHDQQEALDMILHKIGRIISGNPNHEDHWLDISGYAELARLRVQKVLL